MEWICGWKESHWIIESFFQSLWKAGAWLFLLCPLSHLTKGGDDQSPAFGMWLHWIWFRALNWPHGPFCCTNLLFLCPPQWYLSSWDSICWLWFERVALWPKPLKEEFEFLFWFFNLTHCWHPLKCWNKRPPKSLLSFPLRHQLDIYFMVENRTFGLTSVIFFLSELWLLK